jgi:hypothetical protein
VRVFENILKALCYAVALGWLALIVAAQETCSILPSIGHQCHGPDGDVWMLPFFLGIIGLPALIASIIIVVVSAIRRSRG